MLRLQLPPRGTLLPNNGVDPLDFYYKPLVGRLFRARIDTGLALLEGRRFNRLLEIGYGSGILVPTLRPIANDYWGIDLEPPPSALGDQFLKGDATKMSFEDGFFDGVVAFSIYEHLRPEALPTAMAELARVVSPGGHVLIGCPAVHRGMSVAFSAIGFRGIDDHHFSSIVDVLDAAHPHFELASRRALPSVSLPLGWALYTAVLLRKRTSDG